MAKIVLENIDVCFPVYGDSHYSLRRSLVNITTGGKIFQSSGKLTMVQALDNISFSLKNGDRLGLVGGNGAGKSTLLKTLAHLYQPHNGTLVTEGRISTLFDICVGMDQEKTGYQNIFFTGALLGMSKKEIHAILPDVEDFCELQDFLNMPVRTYSAGMRVRLGFALCTALNPAILLLDEAIGVVDQHFVEKAAVRAKALYDRAEILVIASHDASVIKEFCNQALWLHQGKMMAYGNVDEVLQAYHANTHPTTA